MEFSEFYFWFGGDEVMSSFVATFSILFVLSIICILFILFVFFVVLRYCFIKGQFLCIFLFFEWKEMIAPYNITNLRLVPQLH